jgi:pimeloyl-ACP methyl ester carboxylesterase
VLLLAALAGLGLLQHSDPRVPPGAAGDLLTIDGTPLRYVQQGTGPDVLLVHGSPGSIEDWEAVRRQLAPSYRVTAFDRPGHGYSGGEDRPHTAADNAKIVLDLIAVLALKRVILVGHSFGGTVALALAVRNVEEVRSYVVISTRGYGPYRPEPLYRTLALPVVGRGIAAVMLPVIGRGRLEDGLRQNFAPAPVPPDFFASRAPIFLRPTVASALSEERVHMSTELPAMAAHYPEIRKPVIVVCGEQDAYRENDRRLASEIPGARLVLLPNTGHHVPITRPEAVVAAVGEAVTAAAGGGGP